MPDTIQFKYGDQIINRYVADGRKLFTEYFTKLIELSTPIGANTVYSWVYNRSLYELKGNGYVGNMEYSSALNTTDTKTHTLLRVHNPEGYTNNFNNPFTYTYFYYFRRDHLGNTREVWQAPFTNYLAGNRIDPGNVVQRTQYYPNGLPWSEGLNPDNQPYKYNGKEFVEMNGYDTYDYGARGYYAEMGGFMSVDPLTEKKPWNSPYVYCRGNPVNRIDVDGRIDWPLNGISAVNKRDVSGGGYGLANSVVRTSTYLDTNRPPGASNPHCGIDYRASVGTPFYSLGDGTVTTIGSSNKGGNFISVEYQNGDIVTFRHISNSTNGLKVGSNVFEGQPLGETGNTGTKAAHLHIDA